MDIRDFRQHYIKRSLREHDLTGEPFELFAQLFQAAIEKNVLEPNAMTLATYDERDGIQARIVLLKEFDRNGFVFFTNYLSQKGRQLENFPNAALLFWWQELECQVRINGSVEKIDAEASTKYFHVRPRESQAGAIASLQSAPLNDYGQLEAKVVQILADAGDRELERPEHWGGYRVIPVSFEFWQGRPNRLHDRFLYQLQSGEWVVTRLQP